MTRKSTGHTRDETQESWEMLFRRAAAYLGLSLTERQVRRFALYRDELITWNAKMSLLSLKTPLDLPVKHFADALTVLPIVTGGPARLLDAGTGAGFPGIPLAIMHESLEVTLVESSRKKASFLKQATRLLELEKASVIHDRIEEMMNEASKRASYDFVVSRAAFTTAQLVGIAGYFLKPGGMLIAMKGTPPDREIEDALAAAARFDMEDAGRRILELPFGTGARCLVLFRKNIRHRRL